MTVSKTAAILTKLADRLRIGGGSYSGAGQYAALVAMYPFITYFSLFDFVPEVAQPQVFEIVAQTAGGSEGAEAVIQRTAYQVNAILAFFFTGYIPAILRCLWRRAWGWLFVGMIAAHFTLLDLAADFGMVEFGALRDTVADLPMIGAKISFIWIVFRGKILSASFLLYCFTSALAINLDYNWLNDLINCFLVYSWPGGNVFSKITTYMWC